MVLAGPFPDTSNRVLRMFSPSFHDRFVRVNFTDEDFMAYRFDRDMDSTEHVYARVRELLVGQTHPLRQFVDVTKRSVLDGFYLAGRKFDFLGYSSSALREHAVWFVSPFREENGEMWNAKRILSGLGDFTPDRTIYCPARYGARIAQAFRYGYDCSSIFLLIMASS